MTSSLHTLLLSRLREELETAEKATPGEWSFAGEDNAPLTVRNGSKPGDIHVCSITGSAFNSSSIADATFIARGRSLVPALLRGLIAEVERHHDDPGPDSGFCFECGYTWPCAFLRRWADVMGVSE